MNQTKKQAELRTIILDKIYAKGPISRIDISKETGITPATVSAITGSLIQEKLLYELGEDEEHAKVGRKKILLGIKKQHSYFIGCELSEKYFSFVLSDNTGNVIDKEKATVSSEKILAEGADLFCHLLEQFIFRNNSYTIQAVGVAIPGRYLHNDLITTNNQTWKQFDLAKIKNEFSFPIYFSNNVNCMALAKRLFSAYQLDENFIYFHFARGMHCSYMYNGKIYGKSNIVIGEIGHTVVCPDGEVCGCGRRGCLQTYASESWLTKKAKIIFETAELTHLKSLVTDKEEITIQTILTAYNLGDQAILNLLHLAFKYLAQSLLNLSMMIDAKKIYLHSPILTDDKVIAAFYQEISQQPKLLFKDLPELIIEPYNDFTGAVAGVALCLQKEFLSI